MEMLRLTALYGTKSPKTGNREQFTELFKKHGMLIETFK